MLHHLVAVPNGSRAGSIKTGEATQQRGLPGTGGSENPQVRRGRLARESEMERSQVMVDVEAHGPWGYRLGRTGLGRTRATRRGLGDVDPAEEYDDDGDSQSQRRGRQSRG